jgi:hypothetical protein
VSRVCESFHCLPTRALWELEHDPEQMALRILPLRAYAEMKDQVDAVSRNPKAKPEDMPEGELANLVLEHEAELVRGRAAEAVAKRLASLTVDDDDA